MAFAYDLKVLEGGHVQVPRCKVQIEVEVIIILSQREQTDRHIREWRIRSVHLLVLKTFK